MTKAPRVGRGGLAIQDPNVPASQSREIYCVAWYDTYLKKAAKP